MEFSIVTDDDDVQVPLVQTTTKKRKVARNAVEAEAQVVAPPRAASTSPPFLINFEKEEMHQVVHGMPHKDCVAAMMADGLVPSALLSQRKISEVESVVGQTFDKASEKVMLTVLKDAFPEWETPTITVAGFFCMLICLNMRIRQTFQKNELLDMVEYFCGGGAITHACRALGLRCRCFDLMLAETFGDFHNVMTSKGMREWLLTACCLKPNGTMWLALPCSSFVWLCKYSTGRSKDNPWGSPKSKSAVLGNALAHRSLLLSMLGHFTRCFFAAEQPTSSCFGQLPMVANFFVEIETVIIIFWLGAYGAPTKKPVRVWTNMHIMEEIRRKRPLTSGNVVLVTRKIKLGKMRVYGKKQALRLSAVYPQAFGQAVASQINSSLFG